MCGVYAGLVMFAQAEAANTFSSEIETEVMLSQRDPRMMSGASTIGV
jgi:hypothetical protein